MQETESSPTGIIRVPVINPLTAGKLESEGEANGGMNFWRMDAASAFYGIFNSYLIKLRKRTIPRGFCLIDGFRQTIVFQLLRD